MSEFPSTRGGGILDIVGSVPGSSRGTIVTAGGAHTKGAWTQLIAATLHAYEGFLVNIRPTSSGRSAVDIGIGGAGSEQIILPDLLIDNSGASLVAFFPLKIAKGQRVAARCQAETGGVTHHVSLIGIPSSMYGLRGCARGTTLGFSGGTTRGIPLDAGAVANTDSGWVQVTASLALGAKWLYAMFAQATAPGVSTDLLVDIGVGGAGSEAILVPDLNIRNGSVRPCHNLFGPLPIGLPAGSRLSARIRASGTDAGGRTIDVALLLLR